jgi:hypothetical protein
VSDCGKYPYEWPVINDATSKVASQLEKRVAELKREYATLRAVLADAEELERYSGDGRRQWGRCSAWLHPDDAVIIISAKALDAARKEAQP